MANIWFYSHNKIVPRKGNRRYFAQTTIHIGHFNDKQTFCGQAITLHPPGMEWERYGSLPYAKEFSLAPEKKIHECSRCWEIYASRNLPDDPQKR